MPRSSTARPTRWRPTRSSTRSCGVAVAMHEAFHAEREYVAKNLCPCNGCKEVGNLRLKFVAHVGEVATQTIRDRLKLVGIDVILVHRLLKNPVTVPEYVLLTDDLYRTGSAALPDAVHEISPDLEGIGPVRAFYVDVADLDRSVSRRDRRRPGVGAWAGPPTRPAPACPTCSGCDAGGATCVRG